MKSDRLWEILICVKPVLLGLLFASLLYACKADGEFAKDIPLSDTVSAFDSLGPNASGTGNQRMMFSGNVQPGDSVLHVFQQEGQFPYFCRYHGGPDTTGMAGMITVNGTGGSQRHRFVITEMQLPNITVAAGDTVVWVNNDDVIHTVETAQ